MAIATIRVERIDKLLAGDSTVKPIAKGDPDRAAVGVLQDLLIGAGKGLENVESAGFGVFGKQTERALKDFRVRHKLQKPADPVVADKTTLLKLIDESHADPRCSVAYVCLRLGIAYTGLLKAVTLVPVFESKAKFAEPNKNTDGAGLSYGILHWAQGRGRLAEIVQALRDGHPPEVPEQKALFEQTFGPEAGKMLTLIGDKRKRYGLKPDGTAADRKFNLIAGDWLKAFEASARAEVWQKVQVYTALDRFRTALGVIRDYADPKIIDSERSVIFLLDLGNQYGDLENQGAQKLYERAVKENPKEPDETDVAYARRILLKIRDLSLEVLRNKYPKSVIQNPREYGDLAELVKSLRDAADLVSKYLHDSLPKATRNLLAKYKDKTKVPRALRSAVTSGLNKLIGGPSLYEAQRFKDVKLRKETTDLLAEVPHEGTPKLRRLNRLLLEDRYPDYLVRVPESNEVIGPRRRRNFFLDTKWLGEGKFDEN